MVYLTAGKDELLELVAPLELLELLELLCSEDADSDDADELELEDEAAGVPQADSIIAAAQTEPTD